MDMNLYPKIEGRSLHTAYLFVNSQSKKESNISDTANGGMG